MKFKNIKSKILISTLVLGSGIVIGSTLTSCGSSGYTVTYNAGSDHLINGSQTYTAKNQTIINSEPSPDFKEGDNYRFQAWFTTPDCSSGQVTFPLTLNSNLNLYAKFVIDAPEAFTVSFDSDQGSKVPSYTIRKGESLNKPSSERENYTLEGWCEPNSDKVVGFPYVPTKDVTLKAKWRKTKFNVMLHTQGSQPKNTSLTGESGVYATTNSLDKLDSAPVSVAARSGFEGWYDNENYNGNPVTFPYSINESQKDLYAKFNYTDGFNVTLIDKYENTTVKSTLENCKTIPYAPAPIADHAPKKFMGWSLNEGSEEVYDFSTPLEIGEHLNRELYAVWSSKDVYTLTFYDSDGSTQLQDPVQYFNGDVVNDRPNFNKDYFAFDGWYDRKPDEEGATKIKFPFTITKNESFYAKAKRNSFNINIYDSETGNIIETLDHIYGVSNLRDTIITGPRPDDYKLRQLTLDKDGTQEITDDYNNLDVENPNIESILKAGEDKNSFEIYAQWEESSRKYLITIDYGDGTYEYRKHHDPLSVNDLPIVTKLDKTVGYWIGDDGVEYGKSAGQTQYIPSKEITLKVVWDSLYRDIKVLRVDNPDNPDVVREEYVSVFNDGTPKLSSIAYEENKYYNLIGYYVDGSTDVTSLDTAIGKDWRVVKEAWQLANSQATVIYKYNNEELAREEKTLLPKTIDNFRTYEKPFDDYIIDTVQVNDGEVISVTEGQPIPLTLSNTQSTNIINVQLKKTKYTVTYDYNYDGKVYEEKHQNFIRTDYIPTRDGYTFKCWVKDGEEIRTPTPIQEDTTVYAKWNGIERDRKVTFNVGSGQLLARFDGEDETVREKSITSNTDLMYDKFPVVSCEGNIFDGWYDAEVGGTLYDQKVPKDSGDITLYAHWKQMTGFISVCLKISNGGTFKTTGSDYALVTIQKGTKWSKFKKSIPATEYPNNEYIVGSWAFKKPDGTLRTVDDSDEFNESTFLYAQKATNVLTPTDFATDNWATVIAVAENKVPGKTYDNGLQALQTVYPSLKVGATRPITINNKTYTVRVVGLGQDYGSQDKSKVLPITFELTELVYISEFNTNKDKMNWSESTLRGYLNTGGKYFNQFSEILQEHIADTYKVTQELSSTTKTANYYTGDKVKNSYTQYQYATTVTKNKIFIPSCYEIGSSRLPNRDNFVLPQGDDEFEYDYYATTSVDSVYKEYLQMKRCNYWLRNVIIYGSKEYIYKDGKVNKTNYKTNYAYTLSYLRILNDQTGENAGTVVNVGRGVEMMFCIGSPYTK